MRTQTVDRGHRERPRRRMLALVAAAIVGVAGTVLAAGPASAAAETCHYYTWITNLGGYESHVPIGDHTIDCGLVWGNTGPGVVALQETLNDCYLAPAGKTLLQPDGSFGRKTYDALRYAQGIAGTTVDGQYGKNTRRAFAWAGGTGGYGTCYRLP